MEENEWRVQRSLKLGDELWNLRGREWADILKLQEEITQSWDAVKAFSVLFAEAPAALPISHPAAAPPPGALKTDPQPVAGLQPGEIATNIRGVVPKTGKTSGKPYTELVFGDGSKVSVFDSEQVTLAQTAMAQGRLVAVSFVQKGMFRNIGSLRLLGMA